MEEWLVNGGDAKVDPLIQLIVCVCMHSHACAPVCVSVGVFICLPACMCACVFVTVHTWLSISN